jgi:hypothetical protein
MKFFGSETSRFVESVSAGIWTTLAGVAAEAELALVRIGEMASGDADQSRNLARGSAQI